MKKVLTGLVVVALLGLVSVGSVLAITEDQAKVLPILDTLKFEAIKSKVIGGPQKFKISKQTLEFLKKAAEDGDVFIVQNDGSLTIEKAKGETEKK